MLIYAAKMYYCTPRTRNHFFSIKFLLRFTPVPVWWCVFQSHPRVYIHTMYSFDSSHVFFFFVCELQRNQRNRLKTKLNKIVLEWITHYALHGCDLTAQSTLTVWKISLERCRNGICAPKCPTFPNDIIRRSIHKQNNSDRIIHKSQFRFGCLFCFRHISSLAHARTPKSAYNTDFVTIRYIYVFIVSSILPEKTDSLHLAVCVLFDLHVWFLLSLCN